MPGIVLGQQVGHYVSLGDDLVGPVKAVIQLLTVIDSQQSVDGGNDI